MREELIRWSASLRVPRYTSYPTAPHFGPAVGPAEHARWLAALPQTAAVSLYLHVPFCRLLCWYCGCHTRLGRDQARLDRYRAALVAELELVTRALGGPRPLRHLHWGGGTPSVLGPEGLAAVMAAVRERFAVAPDAELAIELDPRTVDAPLLDGLAAMGVNRASLGVQSFDPAVQRAVNRVQDFASTAATVEGLRARGIARVNLDLIYGLPRQTVGNCAETAGQVASLRPDRVAVFGYAHVPGFKPQQRRLERFGLPEAAERVAQAEAIAGVLVREGYVAVGLDHFALPDDPLARAAEAGTLRRNFQGYTTDTADALIGLGASAISCLPQGYAQNLVDLKAWHGAVAAGRLPTARGVALTPDDRLARDLIEAILCRGEVDLEEVAAAHAAPLAACEPDPARFADLERFGVARRDGTRVRVEPGCRPLLRVAAAAFDRHLGAGAERHAPAL